MKIVDDFSDKILKWLGKPEQVTICGVGSPLRGDDAIGSLIVRELKAGLMTTKENLMSSERLEIIDCGEIPENYSLMIRERNPSHLIFIDAAELGTESGSIAIITPEEVKGARFSSHGLPLSKLAEFLTHENNLKILIIGIQPQSCLFGDPVSLELRRIAGILVNKLSEILKVLDFEGS